MSESEPNRSARVLGFLYDLTAMEMNILLKEEGFLQGEPGQYSVTEKGERYADEQHHHRGTGGYAWYNRHWEQRTWNPSIAEELKVTDERRQHLRAEASAARRRSAELRAAEASGPDSPNLGIGDATVSGINPWVVVGGVVLLALTTYGAWRLAPRAKSTWATQAAPRLQRLRTRVLGDGADEQSELADLADGDEDVAE